MRFNILIVLIISFLSWPVQSLQNDDVYAQEVDVNNVDWFKYAKLAQVTPEILYAIALKESGKYISNVFIPSPFAIGIGVDKSIGQLKHQSIYPKTRFEAETVLADLITKGHTNLGIGMMQVSWIYHNDKVQHPFDLLNVHKNLEVAGAILKDCKDRNHSNLSMLSCYSYGEGDDPNGLIYANEAFEYANTYGTSFVRQLMPNGPPIGELNESYLASIWQAIEANTSLQETK